MRAVAVVVLAIAASGVGCILFTGSSDGYSPAEAGALGGSCTVPTDCPGQLCCYELDAGTPGAFCADKCQAASYQVCSEAEQCGDGGSCLSQSCTVEAGSFTVSVSVTTCGVISFCTQ